MKCWYTTSRYGILNNSSSTPADIKSTVRVANYKGALFCVYIADGSTEDVNYIVKPSGANWSSPLNVGAESLSGAPSIFVFNNKLYVLCSGEHHPQEPITAPKLAVYDDLSGRFDISDFSIPFTGVASLTELNGRLFMFYKEPNTTTVLWRSTSDMKAWSTPQSVKVDGVNDLVCELDPVVISYHGLIHIVVNKGGQEGSLLIKYDGESGWARARQFVDRAYSSTPGLAIHNGLLRIVFSGWSGDIRDRALYQYCYDGNSLSAPDTSLNLGAKFEVSMAVQDGVLYVMYHGQDGSE